MMEYANAAQQQVLGGNSVSKMPELGRLKAASERIASIGDRTEQFLSRFHGSPPPTSGAQNPTAPGYRNDLDTLFATIERLETLTAALDHIG